MCNDKVVFADVGLSKKMHNTIGVTELLSWPTHTSEEAKIDRGVYDLVLESLNEDIHIARVLWG